MEKLTEKRLVQYRSLLMHHRESILTQAEDILDDIYYFVGTWDMERCATPYQLKGIDWDATPNGDDEWTFMLNRMTFMPTLINATVLTDDRRFITKAWDLIHDWIVAHPQIDERPSTRTLDTAMRLVHWYDAQKFFEYYGFVDENQTVEVSMTMQLESLRTRYIPKYTLSNWGSIQTATIIYLLGQRNRKDDALFQWALSELETQVAIQIYDDGLHWEQSTMYHVEVMMYLMKAYKGHQVPWLYEGIEKMADALLMQRTPENKMEMFGDSDNSSLTGMFTYCGLYLQDGRFLKFGDIETETYSYFYEHLELDGLHTHPIDPQSMHFDGVASGMFTSRSSWDTDANFTLFTNGSLGSAHGHADNLHVSMIYKGDPVLIDSGRYTYREDDSKRMELKAMAAHNSVILDGYEASIPTGSWTYSKFVNPQKTYVHHIDNVHYYESGYDAKGYSHTRKLQIHDSGIWQIVDELHAKGTHTATIRWHLDPMCTYRDGIITTKHHHSLAIQSDIPLQTEETEMSYHYNELTMHDVLIGSVAFEDHCILTTFLYPSDQTFEQSEIIQGAGTIADATVISAYQIGDLTFVMGHQEIIKGNKILYSAGRPFHAKAIVFTPDKHYRMKT
ncbi:alginate lyase family protein [Erysipelothrix aquatica]|uniref:alginate lyase family protein n=1 Tax=Erysipelothrix aquatica TaxID=2683714 RepID=UPI00135AC9A3|nr:alginate lyase family protein [Erysipelothrix aquatica]